jgi:uncharacterized protein YdeI (YjbR/CyaY-like superfamily)
MNTRNPIVDRVLSKETKWRDEFESLRTIVLECPLTEELKWGQPCYTLEGKNVVLIHGFKEYCALMFIKGALLKDPRKLLVTPGGHQAARQIRFRGLDEVIELTSAVKAYVTEAIAAEKAGLKVKLKGTEEFAMAEAFKAKLKSTPALKAAFGALTPGRQRQYLYHFSQPKLARTREARVEKCIGQILSGKGLNDE